MAEDEEPKKKKRYELGQDLSDMSIDELAEVKAELSAEINRLDEAGKEKMRGLTAAESFFKK